MYNRKIMLRKYSCIGLAHLITWKFLIAFESIDLLQMCLIKIAPSHFCSSLKKKIYSPFWAKIGILPQSFSQHPQDSRASDLTHYDTNIL